jgi:hypothetical protein
MKKPSFLRFIRRRPDGCPIYVKEPLLEPKKPMTANAANRVKDAVERVVDKVEKAADGTAARLNTLSEKALDKFHQVEKSVADPLEDALRGLDDLLGGNGGPS